MWINILAWRNFSAFRLEIHRLEQKLGEAVWVFAMVIIELLNRLLKAHKWYEIILRHGVDDLLKT